MPATFLRLDRPELDGTNLVVRALDPHLRERRRLDHVLPLGYLYDRSETELESDLTMTAGHYDEANQVWSFSGELDGIIGLTEPTSPPGTEPAGSGPTGVPPVEGRSAGRPPVEGGTAGPAPAGSKGDQA